MIRRRQSRRKRPVNWTQLLDSIPFEGMIEIPRPAHLTIYETRDMIEQLAKQRGWKVKTMIVLGHLDARRIR